MACMLLDYVRGDDERAAALRKSRTRSELLRLATAWNVPYKSQKAWEEELDTDEDWFRTTPVPRDAVTPYLDKKVVVLARMTDVEGLSESHCVGASAGTLPVPSVGPSGVGEFDGMWDWEESAVRESAEGWYEAPSGLMVRPRVAPPGVRMLYSRSDARPATVTMGRSGGGEGRGGGGSDGLAVLEFAPARKLVEVRHLMQTIEEVWGFRRHKQQLYAKSHSDDIGWVALGPSEKLLDIAAVSTCVGALEQTLPLQLSTQDWSEASDESVEMSILTYAFDSDAMCDKHKVRHPLLWRKPVEGASHQVRVVLLSFLPISAKLNRLHAPNQKRAPKQVVVAAEMDSAYGTVDGTLDAGVERIYALLDTRSGKVLNSFLHPKPGSAAKVRAHTSRADVNKRCSY